MLRDGDWDDDDELLGKIAYTAFHEIFLHALPDLRAASAGAQSRTEQEDHQIILMPPDETNPLHRAIKTVLPHLPAEIRQYFLDAYVHNVEEQNPRTVGVDDQAAGQWCELLNEHLDDLDSPFWRADPV